MIFTIVNRLNNEKTVLENIESSEQLYTHIKNLNLKEYDFYIDATFPDTGIIKKKTFDIINQLDDKIFVNIILSPGLAACEVIRLLKLKHTNCKLDASKLEVIKHYELLKLIEKFQIDLPDELEIEINPCINFGIKEKLTKLSNMIKKPDFVPIVNSKLSFLALIKILKDIPQDEIIVYLKGDVFSNNNPANIKDLIIQKLIKKSTKDKKTHYVYRTCFFDDIEDIVKLEKYLEIIKTHIPRYHTELELITFVTLFAVNHFIYDKNFLQDPNNLEASDELQTYYNGKKDITPLLFLANFKGVCRHYADFIKYELNSLGIECEVVGCDAKEGGPGHAINLVTINNKQYLLDVTNVAADFKYKDISSLSQSDFFLKSFDECPFFHEFDNWEISSNTFLDFDKSKYQTYDRTDIDNAVKKVKKWYKPYKIHAQDLKNLFRKHQSQREKNIEHNINESIRRI